MHECFCCCLCCWWRCLLLLTLPDVRTRSKPHPHNHFSDQFLRQSNGRRPSSTSSGAIPNQPRNLTHAPNKLPTVQQVATVAFLRSSPIRLLCSLSRKTCGGDVSVREPSARLLPGRYALTWSDISIRRSFRYGAALLGCVRVCLCVFGLCAIFRSEAPWSETERRRTGCSKILQYSCPNRLRLLIML